MSDGWVWLRCQGCGSNMRLLAFSGGSWGQWSDRITVFVDEHSTGRCHGERAMDQEQSRMGYSFLEIVTEKDAPIERLAVNDFLRDPTRLS